MPIVIDATVPRVSTKSASPKLAEAARAYLLAFVQRFDGNATAAAKALGVAQPTVTNMLNGKTAIGFPLLEALADHDGVTFDVVLGVREPEGSRLDLDDRYSARERALKAWRLLGRDEEAAKVVEDMAMDAEDDSTPDQWFAQIAGAQAALRQKTKPRGTGNEDEGKPRMPWRK